MPYLGLPLYYGVNIFDVKVLPYLNMSYFKGLTTTRDLLPDETRGGWTVSEGEGASPILPPLPQSDNEPKIPSGVLPIVFLGLGVGLLGLGRWLYERLNNNVRQIAIQNEIVNRAWVPSEQTLQLRGPRLIEQVRREALAEALARTRGRSGPASGQLGEDFLEAQARADAQAQLIHDRWLRTQARSLRQPQPDFSLGLVPGQVPD